MLVATATVIRMKVAEIRKRNFARLSRQYGPQKELADTLDMTPGYINQILTDRRAIGEKSADKIERKLGLAPGSLSKEHDLVNDSRMAYNIDAPADWLLRAWPDLPLSARQCIWTIVKAHIGDDAERRTKTVHVEHDRRSH